MIPAKNYDTTLSSGIKSTNSASIAMTPEVFDILSSKIYKDKVMAVVREIICNARDACIENKTDKPIVVHLPSYLNSTFYVRDFGKGLSKEATMDLYLSYGVSTKTASNDLIGGMGIGSKSPFAYTNQFTVESFHNGLKHTFLVYKEKGIPCISFTGTVQSDEESGLKVSVSVNSSDIHEFDKKFKLFARFFDYPMVDTVDTLYKTTQNLSVIIDNEHCTVYKKDNYSYEEAYFAVMGGVGYTVSTKYFDSFFDMVSRNEMNMFFFVVKAKIGELSVAASRETLSEDDETVAKLKEKVETLVETFVDSMTESLKDLPHHILVRKLAPFTSILRGSLPERVIETAKRFNIDVFNDESYAKQFITTKIHKPHAGHHSLPVISWEQQSDDSQYFVESGKYEKVFINKLKKVYRPTYDVYMVKEDQKELINAYYGSEQVYHTIEEAAEKFLIEIKTPRKVVAGTKRKYQGVYDLSGKAVDTIEDNCEGFYIPTDKWDISNDLGNHDEYKDFLKFYKEVDTLILMVGKSSIDKIKKNTNMKEFDLKQLEKMLKKIKLTNEMRRALTLKWLYRGNLTSAQLVRKEVLSSVDYKHLAIYKYFTKCDKKLELSVGYVYNTFVKTEFHELASILNVLKVVGLFNIIIPEKYLLEVQEHEQKVVDQLEKDFTKPLEHYYTHDFLTLVNTVIPDYTEYVTKRKTN